MDDQFSCGHLKTGKRTLSFKIQSSSSEPDRDKRKVTQGVKMFTVLQVGRDGMTEKVIHNFSSPPHMPKPSQSILLLLDSLKQLQLKIMQLEGWDFSVLTCICGSATVKQIRILIQSRSSAHNLSGMTEGESTS